MPDNPHIVVHGAGSIGCFVGGAWHAAGRAGHLLRPRERQDEIAENGLTAHRQRAAADRVRGRTRSISRPSRLRSPRRHHRSCASRAPAPSRGEGDRPPRAQGRAGDQLPERGQQCRPAEGRAARFRRSSRGMVPFNVARLGHGRWHKGAAGRLCAEDHAGHARARRTDRQRARAAPPVRRHARRRLGQIADQPQQCGQRSVRPDPARGIERARLSPGLRRLAGRGARNTRSRRDRAGPDRPDPAQAAAARHRLARPDVPQHVPEDAEDRCRARARPWPTISPPDGRPRSTI